jgi:hypothetical protein
MDTALSGSCGWEGTGPHPHDQVSPVSFASKVRTPVLIVHGEDDTNVPVSQAIYFHRALSWFGAEHELVIAITSSTCSGARVHGSTGGFAMKPPMNHPNSNPPDNRQRPAHVTLRRWRLVNQLPRNKARERSSRRCCIYAPKNGRTVSRVRDESDAHPVMCHCRVLKRRRRTPASPGRRRPIDANGDLTCTTNPAPHQQGHSTGDLAGRCAGK